MIETYGFALFAAGALALLYVVQVIIGDLAIDAARHTPGTPVPGAHDNWLFRATRTCANSLENMPPFWALVAVAAAVGAAPGWVNALALTFLLCRLVHMGAYYADLRVVRGYSWMAGLVVMLGLSVAIGVALAVDRAWLTSPLIPTFH